MNTLRIEPIKPHIGAVVHIDKNGLLDEPVIGAVRQALEDRGVLVFPRLNLTDAEQLAFTDKLGTRLNYTRSAPGNDRADEKDVYKITLDKKINSQPEYVLGTFFWHIDGVTINQPLPKATVLSARKLSFSGGQTEFASTYAAFEHLPDEEKKALERLKVVHKMEASMRPVFEQSSEEDLARWRGMSEVMVHPLVWTHNSGRKSLVIGSHADHVVGLPIAHGRSLLCGSRNGRRSQPIATATSGMKVILPSGITAVACTASFHTMRAPAARCTARPSRARSALPHDCLAKGFPSWLITKSCFS